MTAQTGLAVSRDGSANGTTSKGFRLGLGGLLAKNGASGLDVRKGVLWDNGGGVVTGTAGMAYSVRSCNVVVMPSATQGPVVVPNDAALSVATGAAPGSNSRIDVIWVRQHLVAADGGADTDVVSEWNVTQGTAAASPAVPAIPAGAVELARVTVPTGTTATNTLTISQTHLWTAANGAPIPVRDVTERNALTPSIGMVVRRLDAQGRIETYDGTRWDADWITLTLGAGFTTNGTIAPAVRTIGGVVYFRGQVKPTTGTFATTSSIKVVSIGAIPATFRPTSDQILTVAGNSTAAPVIRASVNADGSVNIITGSDAQAYVALGPIIYPVD